MKTRLELQAAFEGEKYAKMQAYDFIFSKGLVNDFNAFVKETQGYTTEDYWQHINTIMDAMLARLSQS